MKPAKLKTWPQHCRCPEAEFWSVGDHVLVGKGQRSSIFVVVGQLSPTAVLVKFKRDLREG